MTISQIKKTVSYFILTFIRIESFSSFSTQDITLIVYLPMCLLQIDVYMEYLPFLIRQLFHITKRSFNGKEIIQKSKLKFSFLYHRQIKMLMIMIHTRSVCMCVVCFVVSFQVKRSCVMYGGLSTRVHTFWIKYRNSWCYIFVYDFLGK